MNKDYALCTQEELASKRQLLGYLQDDLKYMSLLGGGFIETKQAILDMQIDIKESELALKAKAAGTLTYILYRIGRNFRQFAGFMYYIHQSIYSQYFCIKTWIAKRRINKVLSKYANSVPETSGLELTNEMVERNDEIDNAVYNCILALTEKNDDELPWDMAIIGEITDEFKEVLAKHGFKVRHPGIITDADGNEYYAD